MKDFLDSLKNIGKQVVDDITDAMIDVAKQKAAEVGSKLDEKVAEAKRSINKHKQK
jgi:hypothetical protein